MGGEDISAETLAAAEALLFERVEDGGPPPSPILLLGAPRTGSTLLYQLMINAFDVFYVTNFVNRHTPDHPLVGAVLDAAGNPRRPVALVSRYGKTDGPHGPSEGSAVMRTWFGGEHPSETRSSTVLEGRRDHLLESFRGVELHTGRVALIKNAWNCFRVPEWFRLMPETCVIWIRRDVRASALSDLMSRYRHGGGQVWSSATPANYREIQRLPPWQQVVEQQFEFARAIRDGLAKQGDRRLVVWYEDLCAAPERCLGAVESFLRDLGIPARRRDYRPPGLTRAAQTGYDAEDGERIREYVDADARLGHLRYSGRSSESRRAG